MELINNNTFIKSLEEGKINDYLLYELMDEYIKKYHLKHYVTDIDLHHTLTKDNAGEYLNNKISISINNITKYYNTDNTLFLYSKIIEYIYHELIHARQNKLINENKTNIEIKYILIKSYDAININKDRYDIDYSYYPHERSAIILSNKETMEILKDFDININMKPLLLNGYEVDKSPISNVIDLMDDSILNNNLSIYQRLLYGLPLKLNPYRFIYENDKLIQKLKM